MHEWHLLSTMVASICQYKSHKGVHALGTTMTLRCYILLGCGGTNVVVDIAMLRIEINIWEQIHVYYLHIHVIIHMTYA